VTTDQTTPSPRAFNTVQPAATPRPLAESVIYADIDGERLTQIVQNGKK